MKYSYRVISDTPLGVYNGLGNQVVVAPSQYGALTQRDVILYAQSGPQAWPEVRVSLELIERTPESEETRGQA